MAADYSGEVKRSLDNVATILKTAGTSFEGADLLHRGAAA
jgi:hypothetical protein